MRNNKLHRQNERLRRQTTHLQTEMTVQTGHLRKRLQAQMRNATINKALVSQLLTDSEMDSSDSLFSSNDTFTFEMFITCMDLVITHNVSIRNVRPLLQSIFQTYDIHARIPSETTIRNWLETKLSLFNYAIVGIQSTVFLGDNLCLRMDDTALTGPQKETFNAIELRCASNAPWSQFLNEITSYLPKQSNIHNDKSTGALTIGYRNCYSKAADGLMHSVKESCDLVNAEIAAIQNDNVYENLLRTCFSVDQFCFTPIYDRVVAMQTDRARVNVSLFDSFQKVCPQLMSTLQQYFCRRHDASNAVQVIVKYHLWEFHSEDSFHRLTDVKHSFDICSTLGRLFSMCSGSERSANNKLEAFIDTQNYSDLQKSKLKLLLSKLKSHKSTRAFNRMQNCVHVLQLFDLLERFSTQCYSNQYMTTFLFP